MFAAGKTATVSGAAPDDKFNYVTMLLHGDGTNGAQNNTFIDSSTNAFSITRNGNTTQGSFSPYGSNWSNYFSGDSFGGDYFYTSSSIGSYSSNFTVECWINSADVGPVPWCLGSFNLSSGMLIQLSTTVIDVYTSGSPIASFSTSAWTKNTWNHVALVRNSGTITVYVNGISVGTVSHSATLSGSFYVFGQNYAGSVSAGGGKTYLSNVRVTNTAVYTGSFTPSTTPLTAISGTALLTCQANRFVDNSSNAYAFTFQGVPSVQRFNPFGTATAYSTATIGGSGYFDGSDYLAISNGGGSALDMGTGNCTIEMWVYPDTQSTSFPSMFAPKNGWSTGTFYIRYQGSRFGIYWNSVGDPIIDSTNTYAPNAWYHVAFTRSGSTITLWVNGVSAGTATTSASLNLAIGGEVWLGNNTSAGCYYKGLLSNVRVVKGTAVYTAAFTPPTSPLTAISGTSLLTDFTNAAIFDNAMMNDLETVGNAQISTSVKKYGTGSLAFDGTGDYLIPPSGQNVTFGTGNFTIEGWFYWNSLASESAIMWGNGVGWTFYIYPANKLQWGRASPQTPANLLTGSTTLATGQWYHIAVTRNSNTVTLWVNGVSDGTVTDSANYSAAGSLAIGISHSNEYFNGYIDDFRITKGYARYTATFTPPTSALSDTGPY
jgi:hypothetical protein